MVGNSPQYQKLRFFYFALDILRRSRYNDGVGQREKPQTKGAKHVQRHQAPRRHPRRRYSQAGPPSQCHFPPLGRRPSDRKHHPSGPEVPGRSPILQGAGVSVGPQGPQYRMLRILVFLLDFQQGKYIIQIRTKHKKFWT